MILYCIINTLFDFYKLIATNGRVPPRVAISLKLNKYTPPTPTRVNCRVESRRQCVGLRKIAKLATVSTSLNKFANSEVELRLRRVGAVNAVTHPLAVVTKFTISCVHIVFISPTRRRRNSTVESRRRCGLCIR